LKRYLLTAAIPLLGNHAVSMAEVDPIVVTATRTAQTADKTLAAITIITRGDIERQQAHSMQDILRGLPGIRVSNNGGPGKSTSIFLRGSESDHILVLIDGLKIGSPTLGTTAFEQIPIEQIERIEIVRGPRSSLYGSEAIGGVIQIFTRKGGGEIRPSFSIVAGSYNSYKMTAGVTGGGERAWFNINISSNRTEGFNACDGKPPPNGAGCFTIEPDRDGYQNLSTSLRVGYRFENGLEIDARALAVKDETEYDGSFVNESDSEKHVFGATVRFSPADSWQLTLVGGRDQNTSDNFKDGVFVSRFDSERDSVSWQNNFRISGNHLLVVGLDYQADKIDSNLVYPITSRDAQGVFFQYQSGFSKHDLQLSVRSDDIEKIDRYTTAGLAWGYTTENKMRLTASYGTAFKAPNFNELYFPGFGNPNLEVEKSRSFELGLEGKIDSGRWSLNAYETKVYDLIAFDASTFAPANINLARIRGIEAILIGRIKRWNFNGNITLLDPQNRSSGINGGGVLPRRAKQSLRLDVDSRFGPYTIGAMYRLVGKRFDDLANTRELSGYATLDLRAEYWFKRDWRLQVRVDNVFDKEYETAALYNQAGRSLYLSLRYQP